MSVFRNIRSSNKNDDDGSDDDDNKASDFLSSIGSSSNKNENDESDDDGNKGSDFLSSITPGVDETDEILADLEERKNFHIVRKEIVKPHKPLVGVNFDPAWIKKIGTVEKTTLTRPEDESSAEEVESEEDVAENHNDSYSPVPDVDWESEYLEDFESDSQSDSPDEDPESPRPLDTNFSRTKLSDNIYIEYPNKYKHTVEGTLAVPWSQDRRATELKDTTLKFMEKMCTDIYLLMDKQRQKKVLQLSQTDEANVTFSVKVSAAEKEVGYIHIAKIKNKSHWVDRVAQCQGDEIKFHATEIESFYITKIPQREKMIIKPEGNTLTFKENHGLSVDIPPQAVDTAEPIVMQLNNVDKDAMKRRHIMFPEKFKLQKISQRMYIEHEVAEFHKDISVKLDLETFRENVDSEPLEPVAILWKEGEPTFKSQSECRLHQEDKQIVMTMKSFPNKSGLSFGLVAPGRMNHEEAKLAYADVFMCKLTIHVRIIKPQEAMIYTNCFLIENEPFIMSRYQPLCMIGKSEDFYLKNFQRIRVHLSGNSARKKLPKQKVLNSFMVFSNQPKENCLSFVVEKNTSLGGCPNTILDFSVDSGTKRKIHRQEFDPWMLVGMSGCREKSSAFKLSRGQTSVDFKSN